MEKELTIKKAKVKEIKLDEKAIAKVEKSIKEMEDELDGKLYNITKDGGIKDGIIDFVVNEAKWTGLESAGVQELHNMIMKCDKDKLKLDGTAVQALYWFLKQHSAFGLKEATKFITIMKPVSEALSRMQGDKNAFDALQFELAQLNNPQENADITADEKAGKQATK